MMTNTERIDLLRRERRLSHEAWCELLGNFSDADFAYAQKIASEITTKYFGNTIYFRGIIEFTNICKNNCYYCGIRCGNRRVERYQLSEGEILECCDEGYQLGYRTFVLQGGENAFRESEEFCKIIRQIKQRHPDCAVTLSVGECSRAAYEKMFAAGADRYLLRHETADQAHYETLHPSEMSFQNRMRCLRDLQQIGFQVGCGMMVGTPNQTADSLARDMEFMADFQPQMVGIGPFLPHKDTPFAQMPAGNQRLTLFLLCLTRIMLPKVLLPATTALGTAERDGRIQGVLCGCNVVMPNLSPQNLRKNYMLYDNKSGTDLSAAEGLRLLKEQMQSIGRTVVVGRGDYRRDNHD